MDLFKHEDYKEALKLHLRANGRAARGSFKNIAEYLGVNPTLVSQILSGPRHFSEEQIFAVCEYLGFSPLETQYLLTLVQIERAGSVKLRRHYTQQRDLLRKQAMQVAERVPKSRDLTDAEKATFYSHYLYSAVQIATSLEDSVTFDFICKRFQLSPARAREILAFLLESELVKEKNGRYLPGTNFTHLDKRSPFIQKHLANWRLKAIDAAAEMSDEELFYSVNFSLSKKDFPVLRGLMVQLIQDFMAVVKASPAEEIAQFNLDLFWIKK
jgi:uncharacterized protein (TIGR02147 family)